MAKSAISDDPKQRETLLREQLERRVLVFVAAVGTGLQSFQLKDEDFGGKALAGCNENLVRTRPDAVLELHRGYLQAGADIIDTNSFGSTALVLAEYGLSTFAYEISKGAASLARQAAAEFDQPDRPRFVCGCMGPTTKAISVTGGITFDELIQQYCDQARGLIEGGADYLLLETCNDTRTIKAALVGLDRLKSERGLAVPLAITATIERNGTMLAGQPIDAFYASIAHRDLLYVGINCGTGPSTMTDHVRTLARMAETKVACVPNAGLPDENGRYRESAEIMARALGDFGREGWLNILGGCCGVDASHVRAFAELARHLKPRSKMHRAVSMLSGLDYLEVTPEKRPLLVGERTNVLGSRAFKKLVAEQKWEEAGEIARRQVRGGAHLVDVCMQDPDRDEMSDVQAFLERLIRVVKVPLVLDSTDASVIAKGLEYCQGKSLINSINLEHGEERFAKVIPLARQFGAAVVVGCIDEDKDNGMAVTRERKLEVAARSFDLLTKKYGIRPEDIYFDALVFPCGTGDAKYATSAPETIEGLRLIKARFPESKTLLGISNVSFGLPDAGREVLNAVFLYHCTLAGLDVAIVNTEKLARYASLSEEDRSVSEDLLFSRRPDALERFTQHFRGARPSRGASVQSLPLAERLARYIVEGTKDGLLADLQTALQEGQKPLAIINGPLMKGMDEVGRLFGENQLIVAEVLQSAEVMKAAVAFLEPHMDKNQGGSRGKVLLATVKGDVHDIGKNLVEIILKNNGFEVVNLGIKVTPDVLVQEAKKHRPAIIGLSGLLVKSAQMMVETAEDLARNGVQTPILVGGAALTRKFTDLKIAPAYGAQAMVEYARDAMSGLDLAKQIIDPKRAEELRTQISERRLQRETAPAESASEEADVTGDADERAEQRPRGLASAEIPTPGDWARHVETADALDAVWKYLNWTMVYHRLQVRSQIVKRMEAGQRFDDDPVINRQLLVGWEVRGLLDEIKDLVRREKVLVPKAVFQFFRAAGDGDAVEIYPEKNLAPLVRWVLPRQTKRARLCLADYLLPKNKTPSDSMALMVVTVGEGFRVLSERWKQNGDYRRMALLDALATETAEAYAEMIHERLRYLWGIPDAANVSIAEKLRNKYRGKRYSFGYPACPELADQAALFAVLKPEEIGVRLTDGFMMEPEASVSALVFHHPDCVYFRV